MRDGRIFESKLRLSPVCVFGELQASILEFCLVSSESVLGLVVTEVL